MHRHAVGDGRPPTRVGAGVEVRARLDDQIAAAARFQDRQIFVRVVFGRAQNVAALRESVDRVMAIRQRKEDGVTAEPVVMLTAYTARQGSVIGRDG